MQHFRVSQIETSGIYSELMRVPALSLGLYRQRAGTDVIQDPHTEDEIYVVLSGSGQFTVEQESQHVSPGSAIYVPASVPHCFHSVVEDLEVLVLFAPPENSRSSSL